MKLLICVSSFKNDLVEAISKNVVRLARSLEHPIDCTLLTPGDGIRGDPRERVGLQWESYGQEYGYASKIRIFKNIIALGRHLRERPGQVDITHFQLGNPLELFLVRLFVPRLPGIRIATVWQPYIGFGEFFTLLPLFLRHPGGFLHHYLFNTWLLQPLFRLGQGFFHKVVVPTRHQQRQFHFIGKTRLVVIANGVMEENSAARPEPQAGQPGRILYLGHATPVKGMDLLIVALARLQGRIPFRATLALSDFGDTHLAEPLRRAGLAEVVTLKGRVNVATEMREHDLLVLPLRSSVGTSCYPNVVLEALAAGLPLVATDVVVLRELFQEGEGGVLTPRSDPTALCEAMAALLADKSRLAALSRHQRQMFHDRFTFAAFVAAHQQLYSEWAA